MAANPESELDALEMLTEAERAEQQAKEKDRDALSYKRLMSVKPKSVLKLANEL
jgi:hypothetical protein